MKNIASYNYDAINNTLTISADFAKKCNDLNSAEYRLVRQLRAENPGLTVQRRTINASRTHAGIKYADMERYLGMCRTSERYLYCFAKVRELSKGQPNPYKFVRHWFDELCPNYSANPQFDAEGYIVENPEEILTLALPAGKEPIEVLLPTSISA